MNSSLLPDQQTLSLVLAIKAVPLSTHTGAHQSHSLSRHHPLPSLYTCTYIVRVTAHWHTCWLDMAAAVLQQGACARCADNTRVAQPTLLDIWQHPPCAAHGPASCAMCSLTQPRDTHTHYQITEATLLLSRHDGFASCMYHTRHYCYRPQGRIHSGASHPHACHTTVTHTAVADTHTHTDSTTSAGSNRRRILQHRPQRKQQTANP